MILEQGAIPSATQAVTLSTELQHALIRCAEITRERAKNFYYGLRLTPEPRRAALYALYAWMRVGDDCVDDAPTRELAREAFAAFRERSEQTILEGPVQGDDSPIWLALDYAVRRWELPTEPLFAMLDGLAEDLSPQGYQTELEVDRYCERVGSSVGLLCVHIWGVRRGVDSQEAMRLATLRGLAFQRTNILRDIGEDALATPARCYVAQQTLQQFGLSPQQLAEWSEPEACRDLVAHLASHARSLYRASARLDEMIEPDCVPVLDAMTRIYSGVLGCVEREPARSVQGPRARLSTPHKLAIAGRACVASLAARL